MLLFSFWIHIFILKLFRIINICVKNYLPIFIGDWDLSWKLFFSSVIVLHWFELTLHWQIICHSNRMSYFYINKIKLTFHRFRDYFCHYYLDFWLKIMEFLKCFFFKIHCLNYFQQLHLKGAFDFTHKHLIQENIFFQVFEYLHNWCLLVSYFKRVYLIFQRLLFNKYL